MIPQQAELFPADSHPAGLEYRADFLSAAEELRLLETLGELAFEEARYKAWRARRRVLSFGAQYDFDSNELRPAASLPAFLEPLRARIAATTGIAETALAYALIAEYRPGVQLGWHRDVPSFDAVVGISLAAPARMRFRPYAPTAAKRAAFVLDLEPRSLYVLTGAARWRWQHAISPTKALRYSVTFRTASRAPA